MPQSGKDPVSLLLQLRSLAWEFPLASSTGPKRGKREKREPTDIKIISLKLLEIKVDYTY